MAESEKPNSPSGLPELSVEKRMLLAFALVGVVLLLSQFLLAPPAKKPGPTQKQPAVAEQAKPPAGEPPAPAKQQTVTDAQPAPNAVAIAFESVFKVRNILRFAVFSTCWTADATL